MNNDQQADQMPIVLCPFCSNELTHLSDYTSEYVHCANCGHCEEVESDQSILQRVQES